MTEQEFFDTVDTRLREVFNAETADVNVLRQSSRDGLDRFCGPFDGDRIRPLPFDVTRIDDLVSDFRTWLQGRLAEGELTVGPKGPHLLVSFKDADPPAMMIWTLDATAPQSAAGDK